MGYLLEKEKEAAKTLKMAQSYPVVGSEEFNRAPYGVMPFSAFNPNPSDAFPRNPLIVPDRLTIQAPAKVK